MRKLQALPDANDHDEPFSADLSIRFVPNRDTVTLVLSGSEGEGHARGVQVLSPMHKTERRPSYTLLVENKSEQARVVELAVLESFEPPESAPRFSQEWAQWRLPPPIGSNTLTGGEVEESSSRSSVGEAGVDAVSPDYRTLHLLLLPDQIREVALELMPACRAAQAAEYRFAVGGQEVTAAGDNKAGSVGSRIRPAVGSLLLTYPEGHLLSLLPEVYQEAARAERQRTTETLPSFGERFLLGFGEMVDMLDEDISVLPALFGIDTAPQEWLRWLGTWVGLTLDDRWPEMRRRELIRNAITLYRRRGTLGGLADYLELFTGVRPQISDKPIQGMRLGSSARLGSPGTWLGNIAPHTFVVTLAPGRAPLSDTDAAPARREVSSSSTADAGLVWDTVTLAALHDIISASKPAHTAYELRVLQEGATPVVVQSVPDTEVPISTALDSPTEEIPAP